MQSAYGQFVSILYASMVILFEESGPRADRTFGECRAAYASCSGGGSPRTLAIMNRLGQEHRDGIARERGPSSEATSLAAFMLCVTWLRLQSGLTSMCARLTLSLSMVSMIAPSRRCTRRCLCGFALPAGSRAALPTRKTALFSWLRLWSFTSQPDRLYFHDGLTTNSHARICNCCRGGGGAVCSGSVGHMTETWSNLPDIVMAQNMLGFLAS